MYRFSGLCGGLHVNSGKFMKWFGLADCNNFYVSSERIFNLSLKGVPVVVLSNNDGCVISRSQEAKDLGIKMGEPVHLVKELIEQHHVRVFSSNYALYADISARVMNSLKDLCPEVEVYSIDEAFLDLSIFHPEELRNFGLNVKSKILKWTKIPICIGIAPTKTLAKIANRVAKKNADTQGVFVLDTEETRLKVLADFDVSDVWGIGRQRAKFLKNHGIHTALQLSQQDDDFIKRHFNVTGLRLVRELRGQSCLPLQQERTSQKGICCSRSFGKPLMSLGDVSEAVATFANTCGEKLRRQGTCANVVTVFVRTNPFSKTKPQYANGISLNFDVPTDSSSEIIRYAMQGLQMIFKSGFAYKKAGVILTGIIPENQRQTGLFDTVDREKLASISKLMDGLNTRFGRNTVSFAVGGTGKNWQPKVSRRSPKYTTKWADVPKVET